MWIVGANTGDGPLVVDAKGRQIAGGEYGAVDDSDKTVSAHVAAGRLVLLPDLADSPDLSDGPRAAVADVTERNGGAAPEPVAAAHSTRKAAH
ncbi:MAG: hypothetical protein M3256_12300 [Actinomycetota bacterium]|nr:hypothetical protein [Actinomycetota bacterium]